MRGISVLLRATSVSDIEIAIVILWALYSFSLLIHFYYVFIAIFIEFLTEFGDIPLLQSDVSGIMNIDPVLALYDGAFLMNITEYRKGKSSSTWLAQTFLFVYFTSLCFLRNCCLRDEGGNRVQRTRSV